MVDKLDPCKDKVTRLNPGKVICWEGLSQYPKHVSACKYKKKLKFLKAYLRSTMSQDRLNELAIFVY